MCPLLRHLDELLSKEVNQCIHSFVLPGGKIFVFTGILPITHEINGLGIVLGHEIAHQGTSSLTSLSKKPNSFSAIKNAVARHSAERLSSMKVLFVLSIALSTLGFDIGLSRMLLNLVMTLPNSRTAESEADYIGAHPPS